MKKNLILLGIFFIKNILKIKLINNFHTTQENSKKQ